MDDEVSDSAMVASSLIKNNGFLMFFGPKAPHRLYLMEIGQRNSAPMQATAPVGSPECTFSLQEALLAARKVLWLVWEHCWVVRFP